MAPGIGSTVGSGAESAASVGGSSLDDSTKIILIVIIVVLVVLGVLAYLFKRSKADKERSDEEIPYKTSLYQTQRTVAAEGRGDLGAYGIVEQEKQHPTTHVVDRRGGQYYASGGAETAELDAGGGDAPREWRAEWDGSERRRRESTMLKPHHNRGPSNGGIGPRPFSWEQRLSRHNIAHAPIPSSPLPSPGLSPMPHSPLPPSPGLVPPSPREDTTRDSYIVEMQQNMSRLREAEAGDLGTRGGKRKSRDSRGSRALRGFLLPGDERDKRRMSIGR